MDAQCYILQPRDEDNDTIIIKYN